MTIMDKNTTLHILEGLECVYDATSREDLVDSPRSQWPEMIREYQEGKFWFGVIKGLVRWSDEPTREWA